MRELVKKQLRKVAFADLNHFDAENEAFYIPKYTKPSYDLNKCYLIKVSKELINNPNSITAINWNNGTSPSSEYLKIAVNKLLGKNIYVDSLAYDFENQKDLTTLWTGWLNIDEITQIKQL